MVDIHYTTFVLPKNDQLPHDTPFIVFGADTMADTRQLPLVTSLHRIGNEVMPYVHASMVLGVTPVTDQWIRAVEDDYDQRAKVVVLREPVPADIATTYAEVAVGVLGPDLPAWLGMLMAGALKAASRDVPVSCGSDVASALIDPSAPTGSIRAWAHKMIPLR